MTVIDVTVIVEFEVDTIPVLGDLEQFADRLESGKPARFESILSIPQLPDLHVDPEKIDRVRERPANRNENPVANRETAEMIFREYLGVEPASSLFITIDQGLVRHLMMAVRNCLTGGRRNSIGFRCVI